MAIDHTNCDHPRTPAGRRACRDASAGKESKSWAGQLGRAERAHAEAAGLVPPVKLTGPVARRMARTVAKADAMRQARDMSREAVIEDVQAIPPAPVRRERAQTLQRRLESMGDAKYNRVPVSITGRGSKQCVQAELHTGKGRCACGWESK